MAHSYFKLLYHSRERTVPMSTEEKDGKKSSKQKSMPVGVHGTKSSQSGKKPRTVPGKEPAPSMEGKRSTTRSQNSNPYDNLYMVWRVLRDHASSTKPLTAGGVASVLKKQGNFEGSSPSPKTVDSILQHRAEMMGELFGRNVNVQHRPERKGELSGRDVNIKTVGDVLRKQGDSTTATEQTARIVCVGKDKRGYRDYQEILDKKAEKRKVEELSPQERPNRYYYLESPLSDGEWLVLTDLLRFSPWITQEQTVHFLKALHFFAGRRDESAGNDQGEYPFKRENRELLNVIHILHQGIQEKKEVRIVYGRYQPQLQKSGSVKPALLAMLTKEQKQERVIQPLSLLWSNGQYYLVAAHKETGTMHLRVDRIITAVLTSKDFTRCLSGSVAEYRDRSPLMYGGAPVLIQFTCPTYSMNLVMDFFGSAPQYSFLKEDSSRMKVTVKASLEGVRLFALQYMDVVEVLEPPELREKIQESLQSAVKKYEN